MKRRSRHAIPDRLTASGMTARNLHARRPVRFRICPRPASRCVPWSRAMRARMLVVRPEAGLEDRSVRDLPDLLQPGDVLVLNDTKVIPSRLYGLRVREETAARVEIMLHKRESADRWRAFARPAKKLHVGDRIRFGEAAESTACELVRLDAEVEEKGEGGEVALRFSFSGAVPRRGDRPPRRIAAAALHRRQAADRRQGPRRLPDRLRPGRGRRRRADRRPAFHRRAFPPSRRARRQPPLRDAARRAPAPSCR